MTAVNSEFARAPVQARSLRTRATILAAAHQMAQAGGLGALRAEALARSAGVAKGTIFAHFPDMQHLIAALVAERLAGLPGPGAPDTLDSLIAAMHPALHFMVSDAHVVPALARFSGPDGQGLGIDMALCALITALADAIAHLQARGAVSDGNPTLLAEGLMAFAVHASAASLCGSAPAAVTEKTPGNDHGLGTACNSAQALFGLLARRWLSSPG